jgi:hypothetical protein
VPDRCGAQPPSRVASGVTETRRVLAAPSPQAGSLVESRRCAGLLRRPAPEQGRWRSHGDAPGPCGAQPPAGLLAESRRRAGSLRRPAPKQGRWRSLGDALGAGSLVESRRRAGWLRRPAPEQGRWQSHGVTPGSRVLPVICIFTIGFDYNGQNIIVWGPLLAEYDSGHFWKVDLNPARSSGLPLHARPILFKRGRAQPAEGHPFPCLLALASSPSAILSAFP